MSRGKKGKAKQAAKFAKQKHHLSANWLRGRILLEGGKVLREYCCIGCYNYCRINLPACDNRPEECLNKDLLCKAKKN